MKVKVGDIVKFLNDVGGGKVTKIVDKDSALVLNETGFEIPVLIKELLPEENKEVYRPNIEVPVNEPEKNIFEEDPIYTESDDVNFYIAFVPKDKNHIGDCDSEVYLINDSNFFVFYNYAVKKGDKFESKTGKLEPNVKECIGLSEINQLSDNINIVVQLIHYDIKKYDLMEPVSSHLKVKSTKFFKKNSFKENDFFNELAIVIPVIEDNTIKEDIEKLRNPDIIIKDKEKKVGRKRINTPNQNKKENRNIKEVDLHIHELTDDETGMSDNDKLQYQLDVFHKEMKSAIKEDYRRIVFIHGVGSGSLKLKIRSELEHKFKKYQFQDASFKEYGYGATMVLLRR